MTYYAFIQNNQINGTGQCPCISEGTRSFEIAKQVYDDIDRYMWDGSNVVLNPDYDEEQLTLAKEGKYQEANEGAKKYLESGEALYEFEEGKHIEATDGNIAKLTAYALAFVTGQLEPTDTVVWNTKEDETVELTAEQIPAIIAGLGQVQAFVWAMKFPYFVSLIENAETLEEVEAIVIDYTTDIEPSEE